jgi:mannose-6-phosphate isomerase-like protein (cupin superfamily)
MMDAASVDFLSPVALDRATTNVVQADGQTAFRAHRHLEHDEIVFVLAEGSRFRIGDEVRPVRPGDVLHIPAGVLHGPVIPETGRFAAFSIYAPTFDPEHPDRVFEEEMEQS